MNLETKSVNHIILRDNMIGERVSYGMGEIL